MTLQLAIERVLEVIGLLCCISTAALAGWALKNLWPDPEVRTLERRQLNTLLESPLRADSSVRNVAPVSAAEWAELDAVIAALVEPRPTTLARMKPASKRVM